MKLTFLIPSALVFGSITSHAAIPTVFEHTELGQVTRVMGYFEDKRNDDALFLGSIPARPDCVRKENETIDPVSYAWFVMDGDSEAVEAVTPIWCNGGEAFWQFSRKLRAYNKSNGFKPTVASEECYSSDRTWCTGWDFTTPVSDEALSHIGPWLILPVTLAITLPADAVYNVGSYLVSGTDYLIQSKLRFGRYRVVLRADDWALELLEHKRESRRLAHRHFKYLIRGLATP